VRLLLFAHPWRLVGREIEPGLARFLQLKAGVEAFAVAAYELLNEGRDAIL